MVRQRSVSARGFITLQAILLLSAIVIRFKQKTKKGVMRWRKVEKRYIECVLTIVHRK